VGQRLNPALLCETCGYDIGGLPLDAHCPECGQPVRTSLPAARTGSPWQRRASLYSLIATDVACIRRTGEVYSALRIDVSSGVGLAAANLLISGALVVLPWSGVLIGDPIRHAGSTAGRHWVRAAAWVVPLEIVAVASVLLLLTLLEWVGIQLAARTRGWRLTPAAAWQVCAHATVGWIVTGLSSWIGLIAWLNLASLEVGSRGVAGGPLRWAVPVGWAFFGLLVFELLVWVGVRRCRYANPPGAAPTFDSE
jgi:hypothetical protein